MSDYQSNVIFESILEPASEYIREPFTDFDQSRTAAADRLEQALMRHEEFDAEELENLLWDTLVLFQGYPFHTAKNLEFTYILKGNEMFVSRKEKSLTRASIMLAFRKALELGRMASGPKKLGTFGASYLYPIFLYLKIIFRA